jgi:hypothetical protein
LEIARRTLGKDHPDTLIYVHNLGMVFREQNKPKEAEPYLREAVDGARRKLGAEHRTTMTATTNLGSLLVDENRFKEAAELLAPAESTARKVFAVANTRMLALFLMSEGRSRAALREYPAAEAELLEAQPLLVTTRGPEHKETLACTQALVELYTAREAAEPGKGYAAKAAEWGLKLKPMSAVSAPKPPVGSKR